MNQTDHTADSPSGGASHGGYRIGTRTDIGLRRQKNEDHLDVQVTPHGLLMVVCDGMGGHRGGERASRLAVETFLRVVSAGSGDRGTILRTAVAEANRAVIAEAAAMPEYAGMGTTLVAAILEEGRATVVNVGDSRAYLLHGATLQRITRDHSLVWELVEMGQITEAEAEHHPKRNIITRALGNKPDVEPDIFEVSLAQGDLLLLASDGLHGMIPDADIRASLSSNPDPARACDDLVRRALEAGGDDNVSVALARRGDGSPAVDPPTDPGGGGYAPGGGKRWGWIFLAVLLAGATAAFFWVYRMEPEGAPMEGPLADSGLVAPDEAVLFPEDTSSFPADTLIRYDTGVSNGIAPPDDTVRPGDVLRW